MNLDQELNIFPSTPEKDSVVTIGVFDGVHRGHQHLMAHLIRDAKDSDCLSGVVTFRNHPDSIFRSDFRPQYITTLEKRIHLLKNLGVDFVVPITFDTDLAKVRAKDFAASLQQRLRMRGLIIGPDFAMGYKREGNVESLPMMGQDMGFSVKVVDLLSDGDEAVRSTNVREAISRGKVSAVSHMLGRNFSLTGTVVGGDKRGRALGYPTANLEVPPDMLVPANGIYATIAHVGDQRFMAATSIGIRPTFDHTERTIEAFLLEFDNDLYNMEIHLEFVQRLRDELKFDSVDALLEQMAQDVEQTKAILETL